MWRLLAALIGQYVAGTKAFGKGWCSEGTATQKESGTMDLMNLELARARQSVGRAKLDLERAENLLDEDCGVAVNLALCCRIRSAQRRVVEAKQRLTKIDPGRTH